jgi:hypothetical protein
VSTVPPLFASFIDDAAIFPPGNSPLDEAVTAHREHRQAAYADAVGAFVVTDLRLPEVLRLVSTLRDGSSLTSSGQAKSTSVGLSVVVTGGAGSIEGVAKLANRAQAELRGIEIALRDEEDPAGNARRVALAVQAARDDELLADDLPVYVELPHVANTARWLESADVVAENELRLKFRTGGVDAELFPHAHALGRWIEAALDRETPFKCTAGLHNAIAHTDPETGFEHHGFLNILAATEALLAGGDAIGVLSERDPASVAALAGKVPDTTRRWFTSFGSCSLLEPLEDLVNLGLLDAALVSTGSTSDE